MPQAQISFTKNVLMLDIYNDKYGQGVFKHGFSSIGNLSQILWVVGLFERQGYNQDYHPLHTH